MIAWIRHRRALPRVELELAYAAVLREVLARQPQHELEAAAAHKAIRGSSARFSSALRVEAMANRMERKIHERELPPLSADDLRARARRGLCGMAIRPVWGT